MVRVSASLDLRLAGLGRVLRLSDCPEVLDALRAAMAGWPVEVIEAEGMAPPIRLGREGRGYRQRSPALPDGLFFSTPTEAACSLIADLVGEYFDRHPDSIGLHGGSVEVDGRLVIFPASHRAGKSTLTAAFAAAGFRVFGDDVLALTPEGEGMALGIAPRLRLPLPESFAPGFLDYAERHAGPADRRYRYVVPPRGRLASHGEVRPLGAVVLLARDEGVVAPALSRLAPGEGLLRLLCENFAPEVASEALMERFLPLMGQTPCLLLRYSEPLAAARALGGALSGPLPAALPAASLVARPTLSTGALPDGPWAPEQSVLDYPLDDELFLVEVASGAIHRLNPTGRLIWQLLRHEPLSPEELAELLGEHFGLPWGGVLEDVQALLAGLAAAGLVSPAGMVSDCP